MRFADRHEKIERQPGQVTEGDDDEEDHCRPPRGKLFTGDPAKRVGRRKVVAGEDGAESAELMIERLEVAGLQGGEEGNRTQQNPYDPRSAEGELARGHPFD